MTIIEQKERTTRFMAAAWLAGMPVSQIRRAVGEQFDFEISEVDLAEFCAGMESNVGKVVLRWG